MLTPSTAKYLLSNQPKVCHDLGQTSKQTGKFIKFIWTILNTPIFTTGAKQNG